jgi:hypothetical protein
MTTKNTQFTQHPALGGLDVSSDPTVLDANFLTNADNIEYREGGQRKKRPGFRVYSTNSTDPAANTPMVSSTSAVRAIEDMWHYGASLTPTQKYIAVTGASIFASTTGGTWTPVTTASSFGSNDNRRTHITLAGDYAVISDGQTQPVAYDGLALTSTTLVTPSTGANWPIFEGTSYHINRLWYTGVSTSPSLLGYTAANNIFDSTGTDSGSFTVNSGDGDRIIGLSKPFYGSLYIFKGPQKGSVFQLSGSTPATFALAQVGYGAPPLNSRGLVTTPTDIYWLSQYGIHSLETTVKFGNVEQAFLSLPIQKLWRERILKRTVLMNAWGFWHPQRNIVGWCVTPEGELSEHWLLCYNYALSDPKPGGKKFWSIWKLSGFGASCGDVMIIGDNDPNHAGDPHLFLGGEETGLVYEGDQESALNDAGSAYTAKITTPTLTRFETAKGKIPETQEKGFVGIVTYFAPHGSVSANLSVTVDRRVQSTSISLTGGGATLT